MRRSLAGSLALSIAVFAGTASAGTVANEAAKGACSTGGVVGLSDQLVTAQMCIKPGLFVAFAPHAGITLTSSSVKPYLLASARDALWNAAAKLPLQVNSAFRTIADQYVLYYSGACGLAAKPGNSNHETGRAVDLQNWSAATSAMTAAGCTHTYPSSDPVHFDCPGVDARDDSVLAFQRLWNLNNPGDTIAEDGAYGPETESRLAKSPAGGFAKGIDCTAPPSPPPLAAEFVGQGSDATPDASGKAHFRVCAGASFHFWFEVKNVGSASWVDVSDPKADAYGRSVRLGVPGDMPDVFAGTARISLSENANSEVHSAKTSPPGGDCNDKAGCARTVFEKGGIAGTAPAMPGLYKTTWQLVDEGRAWFGPEMWLTYDVVDCPAGDAGEDVGVDPDASPGDAASDGAANQADGGDLTGCACTTVSGRSSLAPSFAVLSGAVLAWARRRRGRDRERAHIST